jgi:hypothetical protein
MATKSQSEVHASVFPESLGSVKDKVLEAVSAFADANQRVVGELLELSSFAAKESLRTYGDLQAAAVEAVRTAPGITIMGPGEAIEELRRDPFAWYRKGLQAAAEGTQRTAKLVETNAQIVARNSERLQASAERTGKEIREAASSYVSRMKEIYRS